jgi:hypothetical protein
MMIGNLSKINKNLSIILQKLGQSLPYGDKEKVPSGAIYYDPAAFNAAAWNGTPIYYARDRPSHPDHEALKINTLAELRARSLVDCGTVEDCRIEDSKLIGVANIRDTAIRAQAERGLLGISTGFDCQLTQAGAIVGTVQPSHILAFIRCGEKRVDTCGVPNDPHSGFSVNNLEDAANLPSYFVIGQAARAVRDVNAVETIKGRGKWDCHTNAYRDHRPEEMPE